MMIPEDVCHYTRADVALEKILLEERLKIGQLRYTNDPKESRTKKPFTSDVESKDCLKGFWLIVFHKH